jgi:hypothetical protein
MALPDTLKHVTGTPLIVADTTDHSPAANNNLGTRTDQIDCTDLAAAAARQSDQLDFGLNRDLHWVLAACIEWEASPEVAAGERVDFYIAWSHSATAAVANPGGVTGSDSAYAGYSAGSLAAALKQLDFIGSMIQDNVITTDQAQIDTCISVFQTKARYGTLVVVNSAASAAFHSDMVETSFRLSPEKTQIQD